jgi:DNA primase
MPIPEEFLAELRDRVDIVDVIGGFVRLRKAGSSFKALCPFHKEKTPSFMVNPERGIYKCFGCGASGNVISFVMETQKVGFVEAVKILAARAGMEVPATAGERAEEGRFEALYEALEFAAQQYESRLWGSDSGGGARDYLVQRGVSVETAKSFRLGYADSSGAFLVRKAKGLGVWDPLLRVGAVLTGRGSYRDMLRDRLVFPILNLSGRVVGFGGRSLDGSDPKYINSRESDLFKKGALLYGFTQARRSIKEAGRAVLVEGYMDVISLHQCGFASAVASAGTALTDRQAAILKRYTDSIVIAFDGDEAGRRAARRSLEVLVAGGLDARVARLQEGADPDSVVRDAGSAAFSEILDAAEDAIEFVSGGARSVDLRQREAAMRGAVSILDLVPDPIRKQVLTQRASDVLGVPERVLADAAAALRRRRGRGSAEPEVQQSVTEIPQLEKEFLRAVMLSPALTREVLEGFDRSLLGNPEARRLFEIVVEAWRAKGSPGPSELMDRTEDPAVRRLIGEIGVEWGGFEFDAEKAVQDCIRRLRERMLRGRLESIKSEIRRKEATGLHEEVGTLALELREVTDQLRALAQETWPAS